MECSYRNVEMKSALQHLCRQLQKIIHSSFNNVPFSELKDCKNILIVRSASIGILREFISKLDNVNDNTRKYIITSYANKHELEELYGDSVEIIEYRHNGNYDISRFDEIFNYLSEKFFDKVVVLYNNRFGAGYENVEEIIERISPDVHYVFNSYMELYRINNLALKKESIQLYRQICNWYWEYSMVERK
ncbi:hypothetical protein GK107_15325 [Geobacillus thermoleovorans]|uniref:Uncharacterized protein n=1 Tax=Bacillus caldolyticus TaxID=1394 RepID=A0ABM6QNR8_BACCL|nr:MULTISPECIES: hypothetical protein [Geobacillus thermoleovorans group]AUI37188.1 hypothetical protein CWI35_12280 [[Bacillus] caldolyticus]UPT60631.1 hypothetical protein GK107_15325 [Geobacillus thermoleovorans]